jgi:hypothetical protein
LRCQVGEVGPAYCETWRIRRGLVFCER